MPPGGCTSISSCDFGVTYQLEKDNNVVILELFTKHAWIGFAQNDFDAGTSMVYFVVIYILLLSLVHCMSEVVPFIDQIN